MVLVSIGPESGGIVSSSDVADAESLVTGAVVPGSAVVAGSGSLVPAADASLTVEDPAAGAAVDTGAFDVLLSLAHAAITTPATATAINDTLSLPSLRFPMCGVYGQGGRALWAVTTCLESRTVHQHNKHGGIIMTDQLDTPDNVSRRNLLLGIGAVAGAAAGAGLLTGGETFAASSPARTALPSAHPHPEVLGAAIPGLTYIAIDAQQFWPSTGPRVYADATGSQPTSPEVRIWAGLPLPAGSVIYQISLSYQTQPIIEISRRKLNPANPAVAPTQAFQQTVPLSPGGPVSTTINLATPVTIESDSSYTVSAFCGAGSSVFNVQIGYLPPTQSFVPLGSAIPPRIFDSRGGPKFAINEERTVDLGIPGARTAIINLTVTETVGAGFVAVFPADLATWPGNSSINWSGPNQDQANGVITRVDATGKIKVRASSGTHVVIDRIGYMI